MGIFGIFKKNENNLEEKMEENFNKSHRESSDFVHGGNRADGRRQPRQRTSGDASGGAYSDRRPYNNRPSYEGRSENNERGERSFGSQGRRPYNREGGERRSYNNEVRERRPYNNDGGERRSYNNEGRERRPYNNDGGERRSYNNGGERRSYNNGGERRSYNNNGDNRGGYKNFNNKFSDNKYDANAKYSHKKQVEYKKQFVDYSVPMRLNKFLANSGICSRREADEYIKAGVVTINGVVVTELGSKLVPNTDQVHFHEQLVKVEKKVYILLNKPKNCVTTVEDTHERMTVLDLVKNACPERIYPVGRLDRNTTGVLLITNDGDLTSKLTHPKYNKKKIYQVTLDKSLELEDMQKVMEGIELEDGIIKADDISYVNEEDMTVVGLEIHSGKNRIVRRIFDHLGYHVTKLDRVYFAGLTKKNLPRGKWRHLSEMEVNMLKMSASAMKENV